MHEKAKMRGRLVIRVRDALTGKLIAEWKYENLIVTSGKKTMARLLGGDAGYANEEVSKMGFGDDNTAPVLGDTDVRNEVILKAATPSYPLDDQVQFDATLGSGEANGSTIRELGLKTETTEYLFSRVVISDIIKTAANTVAVSWIIDF